MLEKTCLETVSITVFRILTFRILYITLLYVSLFPRKSLLFRTFSLIISISILAYLVLFYFLLLVSRNLHFGIHFSSNLYIWRYLFSRNPTLLDNVPRIFYSWYSRLHESLFYQLFDILTT